MEDVLIVVLVCAVAMVLAGGKLIHCGHKRARDCRDDKGIAA